LLERGRELAALGELVERTGDGTAGAAVIDGPAGIGETRLVGEAPRLAAASGFLVCAARLSELEHELAFRVVGQLFERALADGRDRALSRRVVQTR